MFGPIIDIMSLVNNNHFLWTNLSLFSNHSHSAMGNGLPLFKLLVVYVGL